METKEFQRWTAKRKVELLLQLIRGERKLVDVCREHDLKQSEVEAWMDTFVNAGERGLKARAEDEQAAHEAEVRELRAKIGELVLELGRPKKISSPVRETRDCLLTVQGALRAEGKVVSIAQLCRWFGVPRSTFYYRGERSRPARSTRRWWSWSVGSSPRILTTGCPAHRAGAAGAPRGRQPQANPSDSQGQRLADPAAAAGPTAARPGLGLACRAAECALGDRCDACLLRPGWMVPPDGDHRLLRSH